VSKYGEDTDALEALSVSGVEVSGTTTQQSSYVTNETNDQTQLPDTEDMVASCRHQSSV